MVLQCYVRAICCYHFVPRSWRQKTNQTNSFSTWSPHGQRLAQGMSTLSHVITQCYSQGQLDGRENMPYLNQNFFQLSGYISVSELRHVKVVQCCNDSDFKLMRPLKGVSGDSSIYRVAHFIILRVLRFQVICALVSLKPIVTVQYLEKLAENIKKKLELPDADKWV